MSRRQLDIIFSMGGLVFAVLLVALGLVLRNQANFATSYVKDQLSEQKIVFTTADRLTDEEKSWKSSSGCLVDNGGLQLESGGQAECYANNYIALHLEEAAADAGYPGETYASIGSVQRSIRAQLADAQSKNDATAVADLEAKLGEVNTLRDTQFRGETLRGLLLTSYGFSIFGERAQLASTLCLSLAVLALFLSAAGFVHAIKTPNRQESFAGRVTSPAS